MINPYEDTSGFGGEFFDGYAYGVGLDLFMAKGFSPGVAIGKNISTTSDNGIQYEGR